MAPNLLNKLRSMSTRPTAEDVPLATEPFKVTIIGSGNWGTTAAKLVAENTKSSPHFVTQVNMWVYEEQIQGRNLTEIINTEHENVKYLPGIKIPDNVVAEPDLATACKGSHILVFVVPHQFLQNLLPVIKKAMDPNAFAISLIKGIDFDKNGMVLLSDIIRKNLEIDVSVLMGANIANEIAKEDFAEATIGGSVRYGQTLKNLLERPYFRVATVDNADAVELCGALKNVVALGAGFCDGLGWGNNTKAAVIRIGLIEMGRVIELKTKRFPLEILIESCGAADLITTCYGGRNRKCAEAFVKTGESWDQIEKELLNGQKLQGTGTCEELHHVLTSAGVNMEKDYPLFRNIYNIAFQGADPKSLVAGLVAAEKLIDVE